MTRPHYYRGGANEDLLRATLYEPLRAWWQESDGPGEQMEATGTVAVVCEPGDVTRYEIILTDVSKAGFRGKPNLSVCFAGPNVYRTALTSGPGQWGQLDYYVCEKARIPRTHIVASHLASGLVVLAMNALLCAAVLR